jgi:putative DNA primase/helicase
VAGRPDRLPQLASFGGWSDTVRSALTWLGLADPVDTLNAARAEDPRRAELREVLTAWKEAVGTGPGGAITAAQLIKLAESKDTTTSGDYSDGYSTDWAYPELSEALLAVAGHNGRIASRALGNWLRANKSKIADSLRLTNTADQHGHAARWWLEPILR